MQSLQADLPVVLPRLGLLAAALLLCALSVAPAHAEESAPRVIDGARLLAPAAELALEESLTAQAAASDLEGRIESAEALDTWDLEAEAYRRLEALRAAGQPTAMAYLILVVPAQHRFAIAHGPALAPLLDEWTRIEAPARAAVEFERGAWEQGLASLVTAYDAIPLQSEGLSLESANLRRLILIAGVVLLTFTLMRANRRKLPPR